MELPVKNIAFYSFFNPDFDLGSTRDLLYARMNELKIKGIILLGAEGINCSLSGMKEQMDAYLQFFLKATGIQNPKLKVSYSEEVPFKQSKVKIKAHIVAKPGETPIDPAKDHAPYITPEEFHQWIKENKKMLVLDARNDFEYQLGRFQNSVHLGNMHFSDFEDNLHKAVLDRQNTPIVTFCTGGIRCEKAAPLMLKMGFSEVYQLDGGILNYFEKVGRGYFEGECFVFDERIALDEGLKSNAVS